MVYARSRISVSFPCIYLKIQGSPEPQKIKCSERKPALLLCINEIENRHSLNGARPAKPLEQDVLLNCEPDAQISPKGMGKTYEKNLFIFSHAADGSSRRGNNVGARERPYHSGRHLVQTR